MKRLILAALLAVSAAGAVQADDALKAVIGAEHRATNAARDSARHPYETLTFFGIKPTMTVVELVPGGGWYTEILAPYLRDKGKYIGAGSAPDKKGGMAFRARLDANPALYGKAATAVFEPPSRYEIAPAGSVDMVLTFRNIHNFIGGGEEAVKTTFKEIHKVLKPGGVLGVVEHRLPASMKQDEKASSGYVHEAYVIKMAESAGFKLAGKSEVNANPKDKADHEKGVWTLPPVLANKDKDREKYVAIGESDRMTLKFVKQ
ncbi:class I SAM-dependent methyltransferase [Massilia sp. CMS3.1]|uniref:class I SAM-dependent methyltransferase n=1 Tax=Massilia sp. CMS3.1 TaxID=3373083 RepID=UPI003EE4542D